MKNSPAVLVVCPPTRCSDALKAELAEAQVRVIEARGCAEARAILREEGPFEAVITDTRLPDGNWYSILNDLVTSDRQANLIVCSNRDDESFRRRVVDYGAMDLLPISAQPERVRSVVSRAFGRTA